MIASGWYPSRAWLTVATLYILTSMIEANVLIDCTYPGSGEHCLYPLKDITVVKPGEFIVAKLRCLGCPTTTARLEGGRHKITHEQNALLFNISLSSDRMELLLNSDPVFPILSSPPPRLYAPQVPVNFSLASLYSTIECTHQPCRNFDGRCDCITGALGGMALSYDYVALPSPEMDEAVHSWTIQLDALGGHNGYMADPYVEFNSTQQKVLKIHVQYGQDGLLEIMNTTRLIRRTRPSGDTYQDLSAWEKFLKFFGSESDKGREPGHVTRLLPEWGPYGRVGTLEHFLRQIWGQWPWFLISIIVGSVIGGFIFLYAIYRFAVLVHKSPASNGVQDTRKRDDEEDKWSERKRLLNDEDEDEAII